MKTRIEYEPDDIDPKNDLHTALAIAISLSAFEAQMSRKAGDPDDRMIGIMVSSFLNSMQVTGYEIVKAVPNVFREAMKEDKNR